MVGLRLVELRKWRGFLVKRVLLLFSLLAVLFVWATPVYADSPVTSTDFYTAYMDYDIVRKAVETGEVNAEIAAYLSSANNPIGVKAAVINALSWDIDGKNNTEKYLGLIYKKSLAELSLDSLSGDELLVLGYLTVMDDYNQPEKALPVLEKAVNKKSDSLTAALITAIVKGQTADGDIWNETYEVLNDKNLKKDIRTEAVRIIVDYTSLYSDAPVLNFYRQENIMLLYIGDPYMTINGNDYELDFGRDTKPEIKNGSTFLPIGPLIIAMGGSTEWDKNERKVTIKLNSKTIELWIGQRKAVVDGVTKQLTAAPYISNARTMLPLRFITENLGCTVGWDGELKQITITVPNPNYTATAAELWSVGNDLLGYGNYEEAEYYFTESMERDPKYVNSLVGKATALVWLARDEEALELVDAALALNPQNAEAYNVQAMAYSNLGMYEASLASSDKAIKLKPDFAVAYNHKGNALYYMERYQEAIENYDLAIKYDAELFNAYNSKGNALYALGKYEDSIKSYDKALELEPYNATAYYNKGSSLYVLGRFEEAIQCFDQNIELDPNPAYGYYGKAAASAYLNKTADALEALKSAIELDEGLKAWAAGDEAFKNLRTNKIFLQLVN